MLKTLNYDSSLYTPTTSLQRSLPSSEAAQKKTMTSLASKAPLNNRLASPSSINEPRRMSSSSNLYANRSPRPTNTESRDTNVSHNTHYAGSAYRNFDTFNTVSSNKFPASKPRHGKNSNSNDNDSDADTGYSRVNGVQLKPLNKNEHQGEKLYNVPPEQRKVEEVKPVLPPPAPVNKSYLIRMKRKHKNKITANVSGSKFDLSKIYAYLLLTHMR